MGFPEETLNVTHRPIGDAVHMTELSPSESPFEEDLPAVENFPPALSDTHVPDSDGISSSSFEFQPAPESEDVTVPLEHKDDDDDEMYPSQVEEPTDELPSQLSDEPSQEQVEPLSEDLVNESDYPSGEQPEIPQAEISTGEEDTPVDDEPVTVPTDGELADPVAEGDSSTPEQSTPEE